MRSAQVSAISKQLSEEFRQVYLDGEERMRQEGRIRQGLVSNARAELPRSSSASGHNGQSRWMLFNQYRITEPQVIFAFALQSGMMPLTGTTSIKHSLQDLEAKHLQLSEDEMRIIDNL